MPMVWSSTISEDFLFLEFGVIAGKDKRNIAIFVQKSKIASTEEHASAIDVDDSANDMVRKIRCKKDYCPRDFLRPRYTATRYELVDWTDLPAIAQNVGGHISEHPAGRNAICDDARWCKFH